MRTVPEQWQIMTNMSSSNKTWRWKIPHFIISYYKILYYIILYHIILYHIILYDIISYYIIYHIILYHIILYYIISYIILYYIIYYIILYHILYYIVLYYIILYYIILYYITLHYIILCYVILLLWKWCSLFFPSKPPVTGLFPVPLINGKPLAATTALSIFEQWSHGLIERTPRQITQRVLASEHTRRWWVWSDVFWDINWSAMIWNDFGWLVNIN